MKSFDFVRRGDKLSVLCIGAHCDDIEIGVGGTILRWIAAGIHIDAHWCVLSGDNARIAEAEASAAAFLCGAASINFEAAGFRDSYFPYAGSEIKEWMTRLRARVDPDVIFTHRRTDAHQDHREVCLLTSTTFRDHLILEYEIPKWDGDLDQPNVYVPLTAEVLGRKIDLLLSHFGTQRSRDWFDSETFRGLARLRGMECRSAEHYAEAFVVRKAVID